MKLREAFIHWVVCLVIFIGLCFLSELLAIIAYIAAGIYLNRRVLRKLIEWHPVHNIRAAYKKLKDEGCEQVYALGLSLGGILCGLLAEEEHLDGLALICTPIKMKRYLRIAKALSPIIPVVGYPESRDGKTVWGDNLYAQMYGGFSTKKLVDLSRLARKLKKNLAKIDCPALLVAAAGDDKVDPASIEIFCSGAVNVPSVDLAEFEHSPHGCTYGPEKEIVAARCAEFVADLVDKHTVASV